MRGFVARERRLIVLRAAGWAATLFLFWMIGWCIADRYLQLHPAIRLAALGGGVVMAISVIGRPLRRVGRTPDWVEVAQRIESQEPRFAQRLVTIISRLLGRPEHRGSDDILEELVYEVDREVESDRYARLLPIGRALRPWMVCLLIAAVAFGLTRVPGLEMRRLAARFLMPLRDLRPVTTAQLHVTPGAKDVPQATPLQIVVRAERLGHSPVWLHTSEDGGAWTRTIMDAAGDGQYAATIASVERDLTYYVSGGDAESPRYAVRVLRRPAVAEFRIRYTYPAYTGRPPHTVTNTDGVIEAPQGSEALVTVTATEPLQSALLRVGPDKFLMTRAGEDDRIRQTRLQIRTDSRYELDLISTRDVAGAGPQGPTAMQIRALADRPPIARAAQSGEDVRLNPRDILPVPYEVWDDYGIDSLAVRVQVGSNPAFDVPVETPQPASLGPGLRPAAMPRRLAGTQHLDLATLQLSMGDVVTLVVVARDSAGQGGLSDAVHILVSPRSIDLATYERLAELDASAQLAESLVDDLSNALAALDEARQKARADSSAAYAAAARANRRLSAAAETAAMIRRSLLRANVRSSSPELSTALARWVDVYHVTSRLVDQTFRSGVVVGAASPESEAEDAQPNAGELREREAARELIRILTDAARAAQAELKAAAHGERAAAVLADRENLAAAEKRPPPQDPRAADQRKQSLGRMREEIAAGAAALELNAKMPELDERLRAKVTAARDLVRGKQRIDFAAAAREWAQQMQRRQNGPDPFVWPEVLAERLATAAQAEAVRPDADLVRAADMHLAARAATAIEAGRSAGAVQPVSPALLNAYAGAMAALQRVHEMDRRATDVRPADQVEVARNAAASARRLMQQWAGEGAAATAPSELVSTTAPATGASTTRTAIASATKPAAPETLAMDAGAAAAGRDYPQAARLDSALSQQLAADAGAGTTRPTATASMKHVQQAMNAAQRIDTIGQDQEGVAGSTAAAAAKPDAAAEQQAAGLAQQQRELAAQIADVVPLTAPSGSLATPSISPSGSPADDPNWRSRAIAVILSTQRRLAELPQQLTEATETAAVRKMASDRLAMAKREAASAPPDQKAAADRAAAVAARELKEADDRLMAALAPTGAELADVLAVSLEPFAPEAARPREIVSIQLGPALKGFNEALKAKEPDRAKADRSAGEVRQAIEAAQRELAAAQDAFTERDPLVAAKWFAWAAADALSRRPPDWTAAGRHQRNTAAALSRAWDRSIHDAATRRLELVPSMRPLFGTTPTAPEITTPGPRPGGVAQSSVVGAAVPASREWRRLRPRDADDLPTAALRETDPAGYEAALKLYFEAIGKARP